MEIARVVKRGLVGVSVAVFALIVGLSLQFGHMVSTSYHNLFGGTSATQSKVRVVNDRISNAVASGFVNVNRAHADSPGSYSGCGCSCNCGGAW